MADAAPAERGGFRGGFGGRGRGRGRGESFATTFIPDSIARPRISVLTLRLS